MDTGGEGRTGLRERKKQETRVALSWAAIRLCVERGVGDVRVEDIAAEAGVSLRTFRNYFSSKAEAIAARHHDRFRRIADELRARPADEPLWDALRAAVLSGFTLGRDGASAPEQTWLSGMRLLFTEPSLQGEMFKANALAQAELAAAIAERTGADVTRDLHPELAAAVVGTACTVAMGRWLHADPPVPMTTRLAEAIDAVAAGLPVPPTRRSSTR